MTTELTAKHTTATMPPHSANPTQPSGTKTLLKAKQPPKQAVVQIKDRNIVL